MNTELTFRTEPLRTVDYDAARHAILRTIQDQVFPCAADFLLSHRKPRDAVQKITQEDASRVAALKDIRDFFPMLLKVLVEGCKIRLFQYLRNIQLYCLMTTQLLIC